MHIAPPRSPSATTQTVRTVRVVTAALLAVALLAAGVQPAVAEQSEETEEWSDAATEATEDQDPETAETVVTAVEQLVEVGAVENVIADTTTVNPDGSTTTEAAGVTVEVPADGGEPIALTTPEGHQVAIDLPVPTGTDAIVVDGISVFPTDHGAVTQHVTADGGTASTFVLNGPDAPTAYPTTITVANGGELRLEPDGSVAILDGDGTLTSGLAAPWARGADGADVPTWFTVNGDTVTQHIDTSAVTAWPVLADPWWNTVGNYFTCILGVGVPIGTAWVFVGALGWKGAWSAATGQRLTPAANEAFKRYGQRVWNACHRFIRS